MLTKLNVKKYFKKSNYITVSKLPSLVIPIRNLVLSYKSSEKKKCLQLKLLLINVWREKGELEGPVFEFLLYWRFLASHMVNAHMTLCSSLQNYEPAQLWAYCSTWMVQTLYHSWAVTDWSCLLKNCSACNTWTGSDTSHSCGQYSVPDILVCKEIRIFFPFRWRVLQGQVKKELQGIQRAIVGTEANMDYITFTL